MTVAKPFASSPLFGRNVALTWSGRLSYQTIYATRSNEGTQTMGLFLLPEGVDRSWIQRA